MLSAALPQKLTLIGFGIVAVYGLVMQLGKQWDFWDVKERDRAKADEDRKSKVRRTTGEWERRVRRVWGIGRLGEQQRKQSAE